MDPNDKKSRPKDQDEENEERKISQAHE